MIKFCVYRNKALACVLPAGSTVKNPHTMIWWMDKFIILWLYNGSWWMGMISCMKVYGVPRPLRHSHLCVPPCLPSPVFAVNQHQAHLHITFPPPDFLAMTLRAARARLQFGFHCLDDLLHQFLSSTPWCRGTDLRSSRVLQRLEPCRNWFLFQHWKKKVFASQNWRKLHWCAQTKNSFIKKIWS